MQSVTRWISEEIYCSIKRSQNRIFWKLFSKALQMEIGARFEQIRALAKSFDSPEALFRECASALKMLELALGPARCFHIVYAPVGKRVLSILTRYVESIERDLQAGGWWRCRYLIEHILEREILLDEAARKDLAKDFTEALGVQITLAGYNLPSSIDNIFDILLWIKETLPLEAIALTQEVEPYRRSSEWQIEEFPVDDAIDAFTRFFYKIASSIRESLYVTFLVALRYYSKTVSAVRDFYLRISFGKKKKEKYKQRAYAPPNAHRLLPDFSFLDAMSTGFTINIAVEKGNICPTNQMGAHHLENDPLPAKR